MAQPPPPAKTVQESVSDGEAVKEGYAYTDGKVATSGEAIHVMEVPVIDLGLLASSPSAAGELFKLRSALALWGCFQAINHGMSGSFLSKVRELMGQFFALPMEEKQKYASPADDMEGYGNDMVLSEQQVLDWNERLLLIISPKDQRKLDVWPRKPESFRERVQEYSVKLQAIVGVVLKAISLSLNLEENCFLDQVGEQGKMYARFNYYPRCPRLDLVYGLKPHADGSTMTIVLPDEEVLGLQFLRGDQWISVSTIPEAVLINIGDIMEIMSNGILKSPMHRVVTNATSDRISVAVFCCPEEENEIGPAEGLINEDTLRLYKKIFYSEYYQLGKRPIEALKI
ncbi:hypothetical protein EUGRSUZ_C00322 [Eucalyptus grandis]|uniref:Uncharacterized protein n=2 Tax=Eucalyptus grandis TaxID=71139 RepID=A0ACC3LC88_EUCGR|nr:hypothetical protein EUGRSUZ_C00322 [Eucalyptus grandis]